MLPVRPTSPQKQNCPAIRRGSFDFLILRGANGIRTRDPHTASVVRYQLRHSPLVDSSNVHAALMLPQISRHKA